MISVGLVFLICFPLFLMVCGEKFLKKWRTYESICAAAIGFVVSGFFWQFPPETVVSISWVFLSSLLMMLSWWIVLVWRASREKESVFSAKILDYDSTNGKILFRVNMESVIKVESFITLSYRDNRGYEKFYSIAVVENIQKEGLVQAQLIHSVSLDQEKPKEMLMISPTFYKSYIDLIQGE